MSSVDLATSGVLFCVAIWSSQEIVAERRVTRALRCDNCSAIAAAADHSDRDPLSAAIHEDARNTEA